MTKKVLITGGLNGIGFEIVKSLLKKKYIVISIDKEKVIPLEFKTNKFFFNYYFDLLKISQLEKIYNEIISKFKAIDILINNARAGAKKNLNNETIKNWRETFDVNLSSHFFLSQLFLNKKPINHQKSYIINISSISGQLITSQSPSYNISKAALIHMSDYLASYSKKKNCNVNCIIPRMILQKRHQTRYLSKENFEFRKKVEYVHQNKSIGSEKDIFEIIAFLTSGKADFINGAKINLDGGSSVKEQLDLVLNYEFKT